MKVSGQLHHLTTLWTWKDLWYTMDRRLSGPHSQSRHSWECITDLKIVLKPIPTHPSSHSKFSKLKHNL